MVLGGVGDADGEGDGDAVGVADGDASGGPGEAEVCDGAGNDGTGEAAECAGERAAVCRRGLAGRTLVAMTTGPGAWRTGWLTRRWAAVRACGAVDLPCMVSASAAPQLE